MWLALVRIIGSDPIEPPIVAPTESNFGSTRSRGLKFGVSELETFSASTRWRSWCHCILVRSTDSTGRSLIAIAPSSALPPGTMPGRQNLPPVWLTAG